MSELSDKLRAPFSAEVVGQLPKNNKDKNGNIVSTVQLDYVGHAAVTDRLLSVDPDWNWEPLAVDETGLPIYDKSNGLWIKLTVCGITRLGYGDGPDPKQRIGDAIRNAAMRFGVALELWSKDELESQAVTSTPRKRRAPKVAASPTTAQRPQSAPMTSGPSGTISGARSGEIIKEFESAGITDRVERLTLIGSVINRDITSSSELTSREANAVVAWLAKRQREG